MRPRTEVKIEFTEQERTALAGLFEAYLAHLGRKATAADLQSLRRIVEMGTREKPSQELRDFSERLLTLSEEVVPSPLTLSEAAQLYGVEAATLRRACWRQALPGQKRGKTWFVREDDLEVYLNKARLRTRR